MKKQYPPYSKTYGNGNKPYIDYPAKEIDVRQYDPTGIFTPDYQPMTTSINDQNLAKAFYNNRYQNNGDFIQYPQLGYDTAKSFDKNMGVTQLYNNSNQPISKIYNNPSVSYKVNPNPEDPRYGEQPTTYGHQERIQMRDLLNDYMPVGNGVVLPPKSHRGTGNPFSQNLEELKYLNNNPKVYQDYLNGTNATVKMWSERGPCNGLGIGGNCQNFIHDILPRGSAYGFLRPYAPNESVETESKQLKNAYKEIPFFDINKQQRMTNKYFANGLPSNNDPFKLTPGYDKEFWNIYNDPYKMAKTNYKFWDQFGNMDYEDIITNPKTDQSIVKTWEQPKNTMKPLQIAKNPSILSASDYKKSEPEYIDNGGQKIPFNSNYMGFGDPNKHESVTKDFAKGGAVRLESTASVLARFAAFQQMIQRHKMMNEARKQPHPTSKQEKYTFDDLMRLRQYLDSYKPTYSDQQKPVQPRSLSDCIRYGMPSKTKPRSAPSLADVISGVPKPNPRLLETIRGIQKSKPKSRLLDVMLGNLDE